MKITHFIFCFSFLVSFTAEAQIVDKIVAKVDDQVITQSDVKEALKAYEKKLQKNPDSKKRNQSKKERRDQVIQDIINEKVLIGELERQKIEISKEEVNWAIEDEIKQRRISLEGLKSELNKKGLTFENYKKNIREGLKQRQFMQKVVYPRIRVLDYDLHEYYKKHPNDFQGFEKIRFLEIFLTPQTIPSDKNLWGFAQQIYRQLRKGASFAEMAKKYSSGAFAKQGGNSGLMDTKTMRPELLQLLLNLPLNTLSNPIPLSNEVIFICRVVERENPKLRPFNEVKELVRRQYIEARVKDELENYIMEARASHYIEIR